LAEVRTDLPLDVPDEADLLVGEVHEHEVDEAQAEQVAPVSLSPRKLAWRRFRRHKLAMASAVLLILLALMAFFASVVARYPYDKTGVGPVCEGPSGAHWFGTDAIGRDLYSRVVYGGHISLAVGFAVALGATLIGTIIGATAGYFGGKLDNIMMRVTDLFIALPLLVVLILMRNLPNRQPWAREVMGQAGSIRATVFVLSLFFWMTTARIVRGLVLSLKQKEFVEAARAVGADDRRIIFKHLLPNCVGAIIVTVTLNVAAAILLESALSFLGFGVSPPVPTWGNLLSDSKGYFSIAPWLIWFPGLTVVLTVLAVNFFGDGLRDALAPRQQKIG
jgi:ABC-type dipeptide/oligopeptide/nickel transport system permease subunit